MLCAFFFFFNDTATTEIYTLSLHDALPISHHGAPSPRPRRRAGRRESRLRAGRVRRSEEHTSELQSRSDLVCRLLLEKKKNNTPPAHLADTTHVPRLLVCRHSRPLASLHTR